MTAPMLTTESLVCGYSAGQTLFAPLNLHIQAGEITAILGGNGRGKTTLMHTLLGYLSPLAGCVTRYGSIGFVPQRFAPSFAYSVLDIVLMGRASKIGWLSMPSAQDIALATAALSQLDLMDLADRPFNTLSGGQQQRVLIARALTTECQILMLDEPTAALDLQHQASVLQLLRRLAKEQGISVVFSTHDPAQAMMIAQSSLLLMNDGECLHGLNGDILTEDNLTRLYGIPVKMLTVAFAQQHYRTLIPLFTAMES
ncbi:ABC transporter ATP-binding protein [Pectobacteriaceae bacterium CE90]|nr:ABC transporter ATP-binding protein [Pectobacteriaceae bacterium CE90]